MGKTPRLYYDDFFGAGSVPEVANGSTLPLASITGLGSVKYTNSDDTPEIGPLDYQGAILLALDPTAGSALLQLDFGGQLSINASILKGLSIDLDLIVPLTDDPQVIIRAGLIGADAMTGVWMAQDGQEDTTAVQFGNGVDVISISEGVPDWDGHGRIEIDLTNGLDRIKVKGSVDGRGDRIEMLYDRASLLGYTGGLQPFVNIQKTGTNIGTVAVDAWSLQY